MKRTVISLLMMGAACFGSLSPIHAQTAVQRGLNSINRASAEAIVGFLADDELQGREAGLHGSRIAARYLAANLREAGIRPLYGDSYYQPFEACAKERQQKGARWQVHPDSIALLKQGTHRVLHMANVLGIHPGSGRTNMSSWVPTSTTWARTQHWPTIPSTTERTTTPRAYRPCCR